MLWERSIIYIGYIENVIIISKKDGYVGMTHNPEERWYAHQVNMRGKIKRHLYNAMRSYDDIEFTVICVGSKDYVANLEYKLRPKPFIGWNHAIGGECSLNSVPKTKSAIQNHAESNTKVDRLTALNILVDFYEKGLTQPELSEKYKISLSVVWKFCTGVSKAYPDLNDVRKVLKNNSKFWSFRQGTLPEELYDEILTKVENGVRFCVLSKEYNLPAATISDYCKGQWEYLKSFSCYRVVEPKDFRLKYTYKGETNTIPQWAKKLQINEATIRSRLRNKWDFEKIVETPVNKNLSRKIKCQ